MDKSFEIDFDEWELLPDARHALADFELVSEKGLLFSRDIDIHYFSDEKNSSPLIEEKQVCKDISVVPPQPRIIPMTVADHGDVASMLLFKKLKDDEFVDLKIESPRVHAKGPENYYLESEKEGGFYQEKGVEKEIEYCAKEPAEIIIKEKQFGVKIWKYRVSGGVGALCSIGVAAATLCIFILGGRKMHKNQNQSQKIQFQICTDEKRIQQVMQQASRLTDALSAVRGAPVVTRAHISFGGYYDGL